MGRVQWESDRPKPNPWKLVDASHVATESPELLLLEEKGHEEISHVAIQSLERAVVEDEAMSHVATESLGLLLLEEKGLEEMSYVSTQ